MGVSKDATIQEVPVRIVRSGFVSKHSYEITVPSNKALAIWDLLLETGHPENIRPFGTEAQRLLRLELGHPLPGHDTDGLTNPYELGVEAALAMDKPFFVGQRSLKILEKKALSKRLVPFVLAPNYRGEMPQDCNLVIDAGSITGRVTSISFSPTVGRVIGLAYVAPQQASEGAVFEIRTDSGKLAKATVVKAPFFNAQ
jgi:sarcosine oxidase subunit alpha